VEGGAAGAGGAGAGGFCATVSAGTRSAATASKTKMPMRWLIDRCLGKKHQGSKILGRMSVQVKALDSARLENGTAWMLQCFDALCWDNSERFSLIQDWERTVGCYIAGSPAKGKWVGS
jgi:hypothetical protein